MKMNIKKQFGLTLIEVMISLSLGLFFLTIAMQYLITGNESYQSQDSSSRIQENGRFSLQILREHVRMAGFSQLASINPAPIFRGSCGTVDGILAVNCSDDVASNATTLGDRLAVSLTSPAAQDCLGNAVPTPLTTIANVFWVQVVDGVSSLYCNGYDIDANAWLDGNAGAGQPLISGVDQMQVQYGLADPASGIVSRYLNATAVEAASAWASVRTVKVALLVNSGIATNEGEIDSRTVGNTILTNQYTNFTLLDSSYTRASDDLKLRRVYATTIAINNSF